MLTVYGIETTSSKVDIARKIVATVLTVYGIETLNRIYGTLWSHRLQQYLPFTVLKRWYLIHTYHEFRELQQYLPFTVLKHQLITDSDMLRFKSLQQYLPFTVLKLPIGMEHQFFAAYVATVLTVYGIETKKQDLFLPVYRMVATVFTACGI